MNSDNLIWDCTLEIILLIHETKLDSDNSVTLQMQFTWFRIPFLHVSFFHISKVGKNDHLAEGVFIFLSSRMDFIQDNVINS